ncbi:hypothetical protein GGI07_002198 [Coemansia sp. Benny D115]|nr:hypothetical protein GGI07_002198 [Coemansia sp. Benny D115]
MCNSSYPFIAFSYAAFLDHIICAELGNGHSRVVHKVMYDGRPVALKLCLTHSDWDIINKVFNEVDVYKHLESLQGDCILRLLTQGLVTYKCICYFTLVLELIKETLELCECHESDRVENCPKQACNDVMHALEVILNYLSGN